METDRLDYELPAELIAQQPSGSRSESRLLVLDRFDGHVTDSRFDRVSEYLEQGDCLVINDTKVLQARFFARRKTGAKLGGLYLEQTNNGDWLVMLKGAGKVKTGEVIYLKDRNGDDYCEVEIVDKFDEGRCRLGLDNSKGSDVLEEIGFTPLPPYIKRGSDRRQNEADRLRYQTVYAKQAGAVAAPTAGLHFTDEMIERLKAKGVDFARVTLHVGAGTFKSVSTANLEDHEIHSERYFVDETNAEKINSAKDRGGRVVAVGTTSVRVLETVAKDGCVNAGQGQTRLFIIPGYEYKIVDAVITNFHLPKSTLLALVGAFAGLENVLAAYRHAVEQEYRFYSYGDAMFIA